MRKIIIEFTSDNRLMELQGNLLDNMESMEFVELLRLDYEKGIKLGLVNINVKDGYVLEDIELPPHVEFVNVLKSEGNKYTCIFKVKVPKEFKKMMKDFKMDLIWTTPSLISHEKFIISCIGEEKDLKKIIELSKKLGEVKNISFKKAAYQEHDIMSCLTEKQKEIVKAAKKYGYYDMPRKISSKELSKKIGVSTATLLEHLRKAEVRLMENIVGGY
jgi:predicted DNA binding protein